ncbi:bifunctional diguanylate cyclase/phosphodiesterase [uncultured Ilyobacter sp.]|uniref:putative bifunctional diguanylate cyclase/phosphodiesterase n=1 Tax=uncultured Ilyobacter sp. TaxID=544433 RepID=UPI0029C84F96|nr:bifunctional diguanylate cyclase/phosphodiesterase [uncultured Ilyobacter sp.]
MNIILLINKLSRWTTLKGLNRNLMILAILILQMGVFILVYSTGGIKYSYSHMMYLVIILSSFFFGPVGGSLFAITGGFILGPYMPLNTATMEMQLPYNYIYRMFFFIGVGFLSGFITHYLINLLKKIEKDSFYSQITGLPNRKYFENIELGENLKSHLILIDLKNFYKAAEDLGYSFFTEMINAFHRSFKQRIKNLDSMELFHFETSTFAVLLHEKDPKNSIDLFLKFLENPLKIREIDFYPSASIGVSTYKGGNSRFIREAQIAKELASRNLKHYLIFTPEMAKESYANFNLINEIPRALRKNEFFLCYQPKINLKTGEIKNTEALIRWNHPKHGLVPPNDFIEYIETTTFIDDITCWVIRTSLDTIALMEKIDIQMNIAVNVPLKLLEHEKFLHFLFDLKSAGKPVDKIQFEIIERDLIKDFAAAATLILKYKEFGIRFALDDFGTGYSTLSYIQQLPLDKIKLDRIFIKSLKNNKKDIDIVKSSIDIAHILNLEVVAEGVEDKESLDILKEMGCDYAQGYYFTKPVVYEEFIVWYKSYISNL